MILASGILAVALANADDAANIVPETVSDATIPPDVVSGYEGNIPTPEQLLEVLDSMTGISDEEKSILREDLLKSIQGGDSLPQPTSGNDFTMQTVILLSLLGVVALIFGKYFIDFLKGELEKFRVSFRSI